MKLLQILPLVFLLGNSAFAEEKMTVADLKKVLVDLVANHRSDEQIGLRLQQVTLSEQLTPAAIKGLLAVTNAGSAERRQLYLLSVESSLLPPPADDLPADAAMDTAAQADLLTKANAVVVQEMGHAPVLKAHKLTVRFQNGILGIKNTSGTGAGGGIGAGAYSDEQERVYPVLIDEQRSEAKIVVGAEVYPAPVKQRDPAGPLGQISEVAPGLPLHTVLSEIPRAQFKWLRWQMLGERKTAVFGFASPKKQSAYRIDYCCFPVDEHIGSGMQMTANSGTVTEFHPFKTTTGYHGEVYVDAQTGIILRLITYAEPKTTEFVRQEDIRVDFGPVQLGGSTYLVPMHSTILSTVVPNGDAFVKFSQRRTLFDVTYSGFGE